MATKEELETMVKDLKAEVRELRSKLQAQAADDAKLPDTAFGVVRREGKFKFVKLAFDLDQKTSSVGEVVEASTSLANASFKGQKLMVDHIIELVQKEDRVKK